MSQMSVMSAPAPFMRDPEKAYSKAKHLRWMEEDEYSESDSDTSSEESTEDSSSSSASSSLASSYTSGSHSKTGSSSGGSGSSSISKVLSSSRLSGKRSSVSAGSSSSASSTSSASSSAPSTAASSSSSTAVSSSSRSISVSGGGAEQPKQKLRGQDVFRIEEEAVTGIMGALKRWRIKKAAKRRHATLIRYEEEEIKEIEKAELKAIERDKEKIRIERARLIEDISHRRQVEFFDRIKRQDVARYEAEVSERVRQTTQTKVVMGLIEEWGLEADKRRADRDAQAVIDDNNRRGAAAGVKYAARLAGENAGLEAQRAQDEADTQEVLAIMRRAGTIAGVNPPKKVEEDPQKETNRHIELYNRPEEETRGAQRDRKFSFFTIDLKKYKNGESMKGHKIGLEGAVFLSEQLRIGVCPRLKKLDLGWCEIRKPGCDRIIDAFGKLGNTSLVEILDLRMNHMPASSVKRLVKHMRTSDTLRKLKELDLRQNVIGDEGGGALAHTILAGTIPQLRRLNVSSNQMTDLGVSALFKAFNAETISCPKIQNVNCRDNVVSPAVLKSFDPCPVYFQV
mmetsp:Transcript_21417/g.25317  ORF Transcript_21417/g.25317 Transcript_21417/m.25317 type:complete len:568 (+) Transcript_21417:95-1798(+)